MNSEPKKAAALRRELHESDDMLLYLLREIDRYNDDAENPFCPEAKKDSGCEGDCTKCWFGPALAYARRQK